VGRGYPAWRGDPRATLRDLLGHTSGAQDPSDAFIESVLRHPDRDVTQRDSLAATRKPGPRTAGAQYSNAGTDRADASDGGPILPFRAWVHAAVAAGGLAGDVPSLARWAHELLGGRILSPASLKEMTRFHDGDYWLGYGLGLASDASGGLEMWGHSGDGLASHTELWHAPRERLTVAMSWNYSELDSDPVFLRALVRTALG
jgi:CubicO group peptidase (beta-lactamase class C family)